VGYLVGKIPRISSGDQLTDDRDARPIAGKEERGFHSLERRLQRGRGRGEGGGTHTIGNREGSVFDEHRRHVFILLDHGDDEGCVSPLRKER
jgi:hypothetical protein